jgi:hypothetical protein
MRRSRAIAGVAVLLVQALSRSALAGDELNAASRAPESGGAQHGDRERSELVYLDVEVGMAYVDTLALKGGALLDTRSAKSSGFGLSYGAAVGLWLSDATLAVRYRRGDFSDWQLWTLSGEAAMNFRLGRVAPYFGFGAGYASLDGIVSDISRAFTPFAAPAADITGLNLRAHAGADYYMLSWFSLGANLSGDAFFLRRKGDGLLRGSSTDPNSPPGFPYGADGSGNGLGATLSLRLGLHY